MRYLPVLQELFESDSIIFMLIGLVLAVLIGIKRNDIRKSMFSLISSVVLYAVCELVSNIHTNYMIEFPIICRNYCYWWNDWIPDQHIGFKNKEAKSQYLRGDFKRYEASYQV